jgi:hypothetical protein
MIPGRREIRVVPLTLLMLLGYGFGLNNGPSMGTFLNVRGVNTGKPCLHQGLIYHLGLGRMVGGKYFGNQPT